MTQRNMTWTEAAGEVRYIQSINPSYPGQSFNHNPECFARYRKMQSDHARQSGLGDQANQMVMLGAWPRPPRGVDAILHGYDK